jgi:hypothetical protein
MILLEGNQKKVHWAKCLNRQIQKVLKWPSCHFAKIIPSWDNHFGKRTAWSLIYFLNYAYLEIWPSVLFFVHPLVVWMKVENYFWSVSDQLFFIDTYALFCVALYFLNVCPIFVDSQLAWFLIIDQSCTLVWMHQLKFKSWKVSKCTMFARKVLQFCLSHHLSAPPGIEPWGQEQHLKGFWLYVLMKSWFLRFLTNNI